MQRRTWIYGGVWSVAAVVPALPAKLEETVPAGGGDKLCWWFKLGEGPEVPTAPMEVVVWPWPSLDVVVHAVQFPRQEVALGPPSPTAPMALAVWVWEASVNVVSRPAVPENEEETVPAGVKLCECDGISASSPRGVPTIATLPTVPPRGTPLMNLPAKEVSSANPDGQVEVERTMTEGGVTTSHTTVPFWLTVRMDSPGAQLPAMRTCIPVHPGQVIWVALTVPATSSLKAGVVVPIPTFPGFVVEEAKMRGLAAGETLNSMPCRTLSLSTASSSAAWPDPRTQNPIHTGQTRLKLDSL